MEGETVGPTSPDDFSDDAWDPAFSPKGRAAVQSTSVSRPILVWCSLATGALLAGGAMLAAIGLLGGVLPTAPNFYPTIPGLLFHHPVGFPTLLSGGAAVLVLVTGLALRPRGLGAALSVFCGLAGLLCIGVVAVSSLSLIESLLGAVPKGPPGHRQIAR
jgi:hypothetical protein